MSLLLLLAGSSSSAPAFDPSSLSNLTQRFLDEDPTYYGSTVNSYPVLTPEESGTVAQPRAGRCALFDGSNDTASIASFSVGTVHSACIWVKSSDADNMIISSGSGFYLLYFQSNTLYYNVSGGFVSVAQVIDSSWHHLAVTRNGTSVKFYVDGAQVGATQTLAANNANAFVGTGNNGAMNAYDMRLYSVEKSAGEIAAIYNQHLTPTTIDRTGLLGGWWLQEEAGTTGYDWSGNGKNLTYTNITAATFHATDTGVKFSAANSLGHTVSSTTIIPRNEANTAQDAAGSALGVAAVAYPATMEVPCITGNASTVYANLGTGWLPASADFSISVRVYIPSGTKTIFSCATFNIYSDGTSVLSYNYTAGAAVGGSVACTSGAWNTVSYTRSGNNWAITVNGVAGSTGSFSGTISDSTGFNLLRAVNGDSFYSDGRICDVRVTTGGVTTQAPICEGPGGSNTNRDLHKVASDGSSAVISGAIVNGTVATIWANRCPYAQDHFINYGGRVASGVAIPGRLTGSLAADGNAKTHVAGKHGNPGSRLVPNVWNAPELYNIGYTSSIKLAPTDTVQSTSPADTKFRRTASDGDDRYFSTREALTSTDKTNAEAYVA